jgi:hypothetical protein
MTNSHTPQTLQVAPRIGLLGDLHGDMEHLLLVAKTMREHGVFVMVQLGDFGFVWPQRKHGTVENQPTPGSSPPDPLVHRRES